jgi:GH18 family chitinase
MKFRLARHTNNLEKLVDFYINVIGLDFLGEFKNHSGYDGVFIGKKDLDWHLEFTQTNERVDHTFDEDDILVFYPKTQAEYDNIVDRIIQSKATLSLAKNPYWQLNGITLKDPDGHFVVISNLKI